MAQDKTVLRKTEAQIVFDRQSAAAPSASENHWARRDSLHLCLFIFGLFGICGGLFYCFVPDLEDFAAWLILLLISCFLSLSLGSLWRRKRLQISATVRPAIDLPLILLAGIIFTILIFEAFVPVLNLALGSGKKLRSWDFENWKTAVFAVSALVAFGATVWRSKINERQMQNTAQQVENIKKQIELSRDALKETQTNNLAKLTIDAAGLLDDSQSEHKQYAGIQIMSYAAGQPGFPFWQAALDPLLDKFQKIAQDRLEDIAKGLEIYIREEAARLSVKLAYLKKYRQEMELYPDLQDKKIYVVDITRDSFKNIMDALIRIDKISERLETQYDLEGVVIWDKGDRDIIRKVEIPFKNIKNLAYWDVWFTKAVDFNAYPAAQYWDCLFQSCIISGAQELCSARSGSRISHNCVVQGLNIGKISDQGFVSIEESVLALPAVKEQSHYARMLEKCRFGERVRYRGTAAAPDLQALLQQKGIKRRVDYQSYQHYCGIA